MNALLSSPVLSFSSSKALSTNGFGDYSLPGCDAVWINRNKCSIGNGRRLRARVPAVNAVSAATDPVQAEITWQIIVGAIAGVTPFVVAGIEFSKRIIAQRRCEGCGGSGLVLGEKGYFKCPECGVFLPWQSWKRFFSG